MKVFIVFFAFLLSLGCSSMELKRSGIDGKFISSGRPSGEVSVISDFKYIGGGATRSMATDRWGGMNTATISSDAYLFADETKSRGVVFYFRQLPTNWHVVPTAFLSGALNRREERYFEMTFRCGIMIAKPSSDPELTNVIEGISKMNIFNADQMILVNACYNVQNENSLTWIYSFEITQERFSSWIPLHLDDRKREIISRFDMESRKWVTEATK